MKKLLSTISFFLLLFSSYAPTGFRNAEKYGEWVMAYHQNPQPEKLYEAFEYGITNKEIANSETGIW